MRIGRGHQQQPLPWLIEASDRVDGFFKTAIKNAEMPLWRHRRQDIHSQQDSRNEKASTVSTVGMLNALRNAAMSSLPLMMESYGSYLKDSSESLFHLVFPHNKSLPELQNPIEGLWKRFDTNQDGFISSTEFLELTRGLEIIQPESWTTWFRREWPLLDWKIGVFLWQTFGGILMILVLLSVIPGRLHGIAAQVLRWPLLAMIYFLITVELVVYVVIRLFIRLVEYVVAIPKHRNLRRRLLKAQSYREWYDLAQQLDRSQKRDRWLRVLDERTTQRYNWPFIQELMNDMERAKQTGDTMLALAVLQQCTRKNVGGIMSEDLFSFSNTGEPKDIVNAFVEKVVTTARWLASEAARVPLPERLGENSDGLSTPRVQKEMYDEILQQTVREEKNKLWQSLFNAATLNLFASEDGEANEHNGSLSRASHSVYHRLEVLSFLKRARAAYGRTALCLSGGAMMGLYHFGHVKALLEAGVLPHIISGTSGGSVIGAVVCTRTDEELIRDLDPKVLIRYLTCFDRPWADRLKGLWKDGCLLRFEDWMEKILWFTCGQTTFLEAYKKTGRVFCVALSSTTKKAPPVLLNYLTAPNVTVASAVVASAAVPGFISPVRLQCKDKDGVVRFQDGETYVDGSIERDIPVNGLAEMFNCQFFIACQCNPHIVPFFFNPKGAVGRPCRWSSGVQEDSWRGGFLLAALEMYLKNDMKAKFRFLHEVEAAVGFTSSMLVQEFVGSTTIVPQVSFFDYFWLFADPKLEHLYRYYQGGSVAAYEHLSMIKLHYKLVDVIDECIETLESDLPGTKRSRRRRSHVSLPITESGAALIPGLISKTTSDSGQNSSTTESDGLEDEDEYERNWIQTPY